MKNLKIKGIKILGKSEQNSINAGAINIPDPILKCWRLVWLCDPVGFPPLTGRYCRWEKVPVPCSQLIG